MPPGRKIGALLRLSFQHLGGTRSPLRTKPVNRCWKQVDMYSGLKDSSAIPFWNGSTFCIWFQLPTVYLSANGTFGCNLKLGHCLRDLKKKMAQYFFKFVTCLLKYWAQKLARRLRGGFIDYFWLFLLRPGFWSEWNKLIFWKQERNKE